MTSPYLEPDCVPNEPEGNVCFTDQYQKVTLQVLNGINVVWLALALCMTLYNVIFFIFKAKIRNTFIILFYILVIICLVCWEITAVQQTVNPDARYLVFQKIDFPEYFNVTANISQMAFLALFALITATIYQID